MSEIPKLLSPRSASVSSSSLKRLAYALCLKFLFGRRKISSWPMHSTSFASGTWCCTISISSFTSPRTKKKRDWHQLCLLEPSLGDWACSYPQLSSASHLKKGHFTPQQWLLRRTDAASQRPVPVLASLAPEEHWEGEGSHSTPY